MKTVWYFDQDAGDDDYAIWDDALDGWWRIKEIEAPGPVHTWMSRLRPMFGSLFSQPPRRPAPPQTVPLIHLPARS